MDNYFINTTFCNVSHFDPTKSMKIHAQHIMMKPQSLCVWCEQFYLWLVCQCQTLVLIIPGCQWSIVRKTYRTDYDYSCMMLRKYKWMLSYSHFLSVSNCSKIKLIFFSKILQFEFLFHTSIFFALYEVHYLLFIRIYKSYLSCHEVEFKFNPSFHFFSSRY